MRLANTSKPVFVFWRDSPSAPRNGEVRGEFWDVGRLERDDSRFSGINFQPILEAAAQRPVAAARSGLHDPRRHARSSRRCRRNRPCARWRSRRSVTSARASRLPGGSAAPTCSPTCRRAPAQEPLGLRPAVGRRGDLGHRRPPARARASISTSIRASTPGTGCKVAGTLRRDGRAALDRGDVDRAEATAPTESRRRDRRSAAAAAAAARSSSARRRAAKPTPTASRPSGSSSRATWIRKTFATT